MKQQRPMTTTQHPFQKSTNCSTLTTTQLKTNSTRIPSKRNKSTPVHSLTEQRVQEFLVLRRPRHVAPFSAVAHDCLVRVGGEAICEPGAGAVRQGSHLRKRSEEPIVPRRIGRRNDINEEEEEEKGREAFRSEHKRMCKPTTRGNQTSSIIASATYKACDEQACAHPTTTITTTNYCHSPTTAANIPFPKLPPAPGPRQTQPRGNPRLPAP